MFFFRIFGFSSKPFSENEDLNDIVESSEDFKQYLLKNPQIKKRLEEKTNLIQTIKSSNKLANFINSNPRLILPMISNENISQSLIKKEFLIDTLMKEHHMKNLLIQIPNLLGQLVYKEEMISQLKTEQLVRFLNKNKDIAKLLNQKPKLIFPINKNPKVLIHLCKDSSIRDNLLVYPEFCNKFVKSKNPLHFLSDKAKLQKYFDCDISIGTSKNNVPQENGASNSTSGVEIEKQAHISNIAESDNLPSNTIEKVQDQNSEVLESPDENIEIKGNDKYINFFMTDSSYIKYVNFVHGIYGKEEWPKFEKCTICNEGINSDDEQILIHDECMCWVHYKCFVQQILENNFECNYCKAEYRKEINESE